MRVSTEVRTSLAVREQKWTVAPSERKDFIMARPMPFVPPGVVVSDELCVRFVVDVMLAYL